MCIKLLRECMCAKFIKLLLISFAASIALNSFAIELKDIKNIEKLIKIGFFIINLAV